MFVLQVAQRGVILSRRTISVTNDYFQFQLEINIVGVKISIFPTTPSLPYEGVYISQCWNHILPRRCTRKYFFPYICLIFP